MNNKKIADGKREYSDELRHMNRKERANFLMKNIPKSRAYVEEQHEAHA